MPEDRLLKLAHERGLAARAYEIPCAGSFGDGTERFDGWELSISMVTNYYVSTLPDGIGVVVQLFLNTDGRIVATYDRGDVSEYRPDARNTVGTLTIGAPLVIPCNG